MMKFLKRTISTLLLSFLVQNLISQDIPSNQIWYKAKHKLPEEGPYLENRANHFNAKILSHTFKNGKGIITFDENVNVIGINAFSDSFKGKHVYEKINEGPYFLRRIYIPNSVTKLDDEAFEDCEAIKTIKLPNHIEEIGNMVFKDCISLTKIYFYKSVRKIGCKCFYGCKSLSEVSVDPENLYYDSRDNCNAVIHTATNSLIIGCSKTVIPETVTKISKGAFHGSGLKSIVIPSSVTSIEIDAFTDCPFLERVKVKWETPLELHNAEVFDYVDLFLSNTILYVPKGTKEKYKSAEGWKDFRNIVEYDN